MKQPQMYMSQSYIVGLLLAFAGGYLDVYTYVCRGGVFANAQTGNMVLLAINLAEKKPEMVLKYTFPILAFMAGVLIVEIIRYRFRFNTKIHWRQIIIALELAVLWSIAFVPSGEQDDLVNLAVAFVCSMQVESFRTFEKSSSYATTMCTGNLRTATEHLFYARMNKDHAMQKKSLKYYGIILIFIVGATVSMLITQKYGEKSILIACCFLLAVFVLMFIPAQETEKP